MKLRIEKAIYGGACLSRISEHEAELAGKTVFTPLSLPGELVEAHITEDKRSFINAEADAILEPSLLRTTPTCPYFGACGGCSYQHAVYAHQLEIKALILQETLQRAQIVTVPTINSVSGNPWHYRNRIRLHILQDPFALGYRERRSHRVLLIAECPIAVPLLEKATAVVTELGGCLSLVDFCSEIEFFTNAEEDSLLISFLAEHAGRGAQARLASICHALGKQLPQLNGAALFTVKAKQPPRPVANWGAPALLYDAAGFKFHVSLGAFFQVNRFLVDPLAELVTANLKGRIAWDLYAGVGLFARALTRNFERVIAVESAAPSAADLRRNLEGTSHRAIQSTTLDFLRKQKPSGKSTPPDLIVVDPPRAGLGSAITSLLSASGAPRIAYVSCDPATLSRDLAALLQSGYDLQTITMVDLFPQTFHLESVSMLTRR
jgi:23S rRNA (uracil1939-C5)-methyltransferase